VEARRVAVFFYGLFMDVDLLRAKGAQPEHVRHASVAGFALHIGQRATLVPSDARTFGLLMELTQAEIEHLYADASVTSYRPEAILAECADGSSVPALCFNLVNEPRPEEANAAYATKLRELKARLGVP